MQKLREHEKHEDARERKKLSVFFEHKLIVECEVCDIHGDVEDAHRYECLILIKLIELQYLFENIQLCEQGQFFIEICAYYLNNLVESGVSEYL